MGETNRLFRRNEWGKEERNRWIVDLEMKGMRIQSIVKYKMLMIRRTAAKLQSQSQRRMGNEKAWTELMKQSEIEEECKWISGFAHFLLPRLNKWNSKVKNEEKLDEKHLQPFL